MTASSPRGPWIVYGWDPKAEQRAFVGLTVVVIDGTPYVRVIRESAQIDLDQVNMRALAKAVAEAGAAAAELCRALQQNGPQGRRR